MGEGELWIVMFIGSFNRNTNVSRSRSRTMRVRHVRRGVLAGRNRGGGFAGGDARKGIEPCGYDERVKNGV